MPTWLRRVTFNMIKDFYEKEAEEIEKQNNSLKNKSTGEVSRPNIPPPSSTYKSKAPKR